ncbi:MAG: hypothetical protein ACD_62C00357G0013 [uncultured bacterium]|nr:MAG: hypothetical protein ACD_62C00357G0013 [uncultured bacterium]
MYKRAQLFKNADNSSFFVFGARQTGKTTLFSQIYPEALRYDLLSPAEFERLTRDPNLLHQEIITRSGSNVDQKIPIIIDEIQRIPVLLDVIQSLIDKEKFQFILSGSSARKLKRQNANLLGGRALSYSLFPLTAHEITDFNLLQALNRGMIPNHYLNTNFQKRLQAYVGLYLKEEVATEAAVRNLQAFAKFLDAAAFSNGEMVSFTNIASECGVSPITAKEYFNILSDTLIGRFLPAFTKKAKRRVKHAPKFYFFDLGITNHLLKRSEIQPGTENFGRVFEHFIYQELVAHSHYSGRDYSLSYWRTIADTEVDFILGDHEVAIEVKGTSEVKPKQLKGLRVFMEEFAVKKAIVVSCDQRPRKVDQILIIPWQDFVQQLWNDDVM